MDVSNEIFFNVINAGTLSGLISLLKSEHESIKESPSFDPNDSLYRDYLDLTDSNFIINLSTLPHRLFIGIYHINKIIGYACVMDCTPTLHLDNLYIRKDFRNRKVGKYFLENFPIQGVCTNPKNERAIDLYRSAGFKIKDINPESKTSILLTRMRKYRSTHDCCDDSICKINLLHFADRNTLEIIHPHLKQEN